jgi:hypothetical protein
MKEANMNEHRKRILLEIKEWISKDTGEIYDPPDEELIDIILDAFLFHIISGVKHNGGSMENKKSVKA